MSGQGLGAQSTSRGRERAVWKFQVPIRMQPGFVPVQMPARSEVVRVGQQAGDVFVWAVVEPWETEFETRRLGAFPTGAIVSTQSAAYVGTTEVEDGAIVVHVFEDVYHAALEGGSDGR